jgi:shikimate kinase
MMGVGKSTVGRCVADALKAEFVDLDHLVSLSAGCDIAALFSAEGEEGFRRRERRALREVAGGPAVVACGGGVVDDSTNISVMRAHGVVAWLDAPAEVLAERVGAGSGRPMLAGAPRGRLRSLRRQRHRKYRAAADRRFQTGGRDPGEVASEVVEWWRSIS